MLKSMGDTEWGNCQIGNVLKSGKEFQSTVTGEIYKMNFHFDSNSICFVYFITRKVCKKLVYM